MARTNVDTDILNEVFIVNRELSDYISDFGNDIPGNLIKLISDLDWVCYHLRNSIDHGESYGENLELRSRN